MFVSFSFANGLCLVLISILVFEVCQRENEANSSAGVSESNDLEWTYCKNPLIEPTWRNPLTCTSTRQLFVTLANDCARSRKRSKLNALNASQATDQTALQEKNCSERDYQQDVLDSITLEVVRITKEEYEEVQEGDDVLADIKLAVKVRKESNATSLADSIVIALLVLLAVVSIKELYKETIAKHSQVKY